MATPLLLLLLLCGAWDGPGPGAAARAPCRCPLEMQPYVCGSDGNTYPSRCDLDCAKMSNPGLTLWRDGPCSYVPADEAGGMQVAALSGCLMHCLFDSDACRQNSCRNGVYDESDGECLEKCAVAAATCTCGCKRALPTPRTPPTRSAAATTALPPPDVRWTVQQMLRRWRQGGGHGLTRGLDGGESQQNAPRVHQCVEKSGEDMAKSLAHCGKDSACAVGSSQLGLDNMCRCATDAAPGTAPAAGVSIVAVMVTWLAARAKAV